MALRCATMISEIRASREHVVLLDCGRFVPGSAESILSKGLLPSKVLELLNYDVRLLSAEELRNRAERSDGMGLPGHVPVLAANWKHLLGAPQGRPRMLRYWFKDIAGVRIAVTGIDERLGARQGGGAWPPASGFLATEPVLLDVLKSMRKSSPDICVLLCYFEGSPGAGPVLRRAEELARRFPDFDLILMGGAGGMLRSHRVHETTLAQASWGARGLGRIDLKYDASQRRIQWMNSDVLPVDADVGEDAGLRSQLGSSLGRIRRELEEIVGYCEGPIGGSQRWPGQSAMQELVSLAVGPGVDAVLVGREPGGMLSKGRIRYGDILRAVPDIQGWADIRVNPSELREILAENVEFLETRWFLGASGISYQADPSAKIGERVTDVCLADGIRPDASRRLHIRFPAYLLAAGQRGPERARLRATARRRQSQCSDPCLDTRASVARYIRDHSPLSIKPRRTLTLHSNKR